MLNDENRMPILQFGVDMFGTAVAAGITAGVTALGAVILDSAGWTMDSVDLNTNDLAKSAAVGTAVIVGGVSVIKLLVNCCVGQNIVSKSLGGAVGGIAGLYVVPAGAAMLKLLHSGCATGYTFTAPIIGASVLGGGIACLAGFGACCYLCVNSMGDVNILKLPADKTDDKGNYVFDVADLEKGEIVPLESVFPNISKNPTLLKEISEEVGIEINKHDMFVSGKKKSYLVQSNNLKEVKFRDMMNKDKLTLVDLNLNHDTCPVDSKKINAMC